jgi:hypothetical protein
MCIRKTSTNVAITLDTNVAITLDTSRVHLRPRLSHAGAEFRVVLLELGRRLGKQHNHGVHTTSNRTHENATNHQTDNEPEQEGNCFGVAAGVVEKVRRHFEYEPDTSHDGPYRHGYQ